MTEPYGMPPLRMLSRAVHEVGMECSGDRLRLSKRELARMGLGNAIAHAEIALERGVVATSETTVRMILWQAYTAYGGHN
jgi:hypothetical protein